MIDVTTSVEDATYTDELRQAFERQKRTFDLAMTASQMGTWRYTLADNICVYDKNAQRLYGLTEPRFLHDEAGVKSKFHPDDLELMWSRVAKALDPRSDGRYDVEYRVKQPDGSWRWLSAWGLVEFEGDGELDITGVAPLESAGPSDLSFINSRKAAQQADASEAGCLIVPMDFPGDRTLIRATSPRTAFARAITKLYPAAKPAPGIRI